MTRPRLTEHCDDQQWADLMARYPELNGPIPCLVYEGLRTYGLKEDKGPGTHPFIVSMLRDLGEAALPVTSDDQAWCSIWLAWTVRQCGLSLPVRPSWALGWVRWPGAVAVPISMAKIGDVMLFGRGDPMKQLGHPMVVIRVETLAVGWPTIHGLGGNQQDSVSVTTKTMKNAVACLRPPMEGMM